MNIQKIPHTRSLLAQRKNSLQKIFGTYFPYLQKEFNSSDPAAMLEPFFPVVQPKQGHHYLGKLHFKFKQDPLPHAVLSDSSLDFTWDSQNNFLSVQTPKGKQGYSRCTQLHVVPDPNSSLGDRKYILQTRDGCRVLDEQGKAIILGSAEAMSNGKDLSLTSQGVLQHKKTFIAKLGMYTCSDSAKKNMNDPAGIGIPLKAVTSLTYTLDDQHSNFFEPIKDMQDHFMIHSKNEIPETIGIETSIKINKLFLMTKSMLEANPYILQKEITHYLEGK